ncbi:MAG: DUF192 domain-containing protein [Bacillota bacterium]|nr:DUF192 domain-containing protein [Bacillota bacterium]
MIKKLYYKNKVIAEIYLADTFIKRFLGYMFQKQPKYKSIAICPCNSIHTFFMKFNLDVLFVNDEMKVIKKISDLKPGKTIFPVKEAKMVIEAKTGTFCNLAEGDFIKF